MARLPQKVDARYERLKRAEREGGPVPLSKATMRHVAEAAVDGRLAFFGDALARECALRRRSRMARLRRQASFPSQKGLDGFEWPGIVFPRGFTRDDMLSLALIGAREDLALFGGSGNGKTHTAIALGLLACGEGGKVAFWSTAEPVSELRRANKEGTAQDALRRLGRCGLIILDERGYLPTDPDGARLLFRVVSMRYERIAPILTTNIEFSRWGEIFAGDDMAKAMMDRIVRHGRLVTYDRESYRVEHALMRGELEEKKGSVPGRRSCVKNLHADV